MNGFDKEMQAALRADAEKLSAMTGKEHTVEFFSTPEDIYQDAVSAAKPIIEALIAQEYNTETWGLKSRLAALSKAEGLTQSRPRQTEEEMMSITEEKLGRFDHHPDPAIDFEVEVEELIAMAINRRMGFDPEPELERRVERAMEFRVGGVPSCVAAKAELRKIDAELRSKPA